VAAGLGDAWLVPERVRAFPGLPGSVSPGQLSRWTEVDRRRKRRSLRRDPHPRLRCRHAPLSRPLRADQSLRPGLPSLSGPGHSARHSDELTTTEICQVLGDLAALGSPRPIVVLTGGDPFKRPDLVDLVGHGAALGLSMAVSPSGTPLATRNRLAELRNAGARAVSFSIDGATAARHDAFRGVAGSYSLTLRACRAARELGMRLQINTTVISTTVDDLPGIAQIVRSVGAKMWSIFFLVETGRGRELTPLPASDIEDVLHVLADLSGSRPR
jgi:molybdenum cofactor biosynthesis enzyme MoaA